MEGFGFGKASGPSAPPKSQPTFGNSSPSFSDSPSPSFSQPEVLSRVQSHPVAFQTTGPGPSRAPAPAPAPSFHQQSAGFDRGPGTTGRIRSPSFAYESTRSAAAASSSHPSVGPNRSFLSPPRAAKEQRSFVRVIDNRSHPSHGIASVSTLKSLERDVGDVAQLHTKSTTSPTFMSRDEKLSKYSGQPVIRRPIALSPTFQNQPNLRGDYAHSLGYQDPPPSLQLYGHDTNVFAESVNVQAPKRTKSPELPFATDVQSGLINSQRPSDSPPRSFSRKNGDEALASMKSFYSESAATRPVSFPVPKRTRSPSDEVFDGNAYSTRDDTERETLAKAKRLARFKVELSETAQSNLGSVDEGGNAYKNEHLMSERNKYMSNQSLELSENLANGNSMADYEGMESASIIMGLCPDMCPESERAERERKGDLDHYERLDGDRNQTSKFLAVKKYTRTAEREANLIRPIPILLKTIDYLLNLLSRPYDENFLGIYNFLWDRMRAIRMDLRMQHIFNENAITMLEQMIRLHIIAMHELCEFSKGEGFAEGFDAHLNIEQMNKTSVELFQMYDDHRKRGVNVPSEKEFRGYYALLKLDKHPGYKVEPAELSLDLAKMTPEMRQTPEVKFARDVARACRTNNFIAFFRLARKASYLQACLMHAHFAKLRTQALASLHSGLLNNQGIPITHLCKWIGMEEEDIEGLLEYHGFFIKEFEEPYMVREGPFFNNDKDYATKCSKLVHGKRSRMIVNDVSPSSQSKPTKQIQMPRINKEPQTLAFEKKGSPRTTTKKKSPVYAVDEEMVELDDELPPEDHKQVQPVIESPRPRIRKFHKYNPEAEGASSLQSGPKSSEPLQTEVKFVGNYDGLFMTSPMRNISTGMPIVKFVPLPNVSEASLQDRALSAHTDAAMDHSEPLSLVNNVRGDEHLYAFQENKLNIVVENDQDEEIANAKLKLILRLWRRRSLKKKQVREQRLLAANAAFNTLSLGPPIQFNKDRIKNLGEFDIDHAMRERQKKQELSWSILNVSDVVAGTLSRRNLDVKCVCWKLLVCSQTDQMIQATHFAAGSWLLSKLIPSFKTDDQVFSSPCLSIWKNWVSCGTGTDLTCCLSIVKDTKFDHLTETVHGASAVLFLLTESIPLALQRVQLHKLLMSIPSGSRLPLLILSDFYDVEVSASSILANTLGLNDLDKSRICGFQVISLLEDPHLGFFSDEKLKEGLMWLANESPPQPVLRHVKMLDLVVAHLNYSLKMLNSMKDEDVGPDSCISAFNMSLDQSFMDITAAAESNPSNWPCPEITLLEEYSDEHRMLTHVLPNVGWSSVENVEPLKQAVMDLKLPNFPDDISWLSKGSNMGKEICTQRDKLERILISYLTQSSKMMGQQLATKEARLMLQHCAKLELRNFDYYIVPDWVTIFRRIFNWRLRNLAGGAFVYIVDCCHAASPTSVDVSSFKIEINKRAYHLSQPLLDEVIEVGCSSLSMDHQGRRFPEARHPLAAVVSNGRPPEVVSNMISSVNDDGDNDGGNNILENSFISSKTVPNLNQGLDSAGIEIAVDGRVKFEAVKLSKLLNSCNMIQNAIDEKLSIYF